MKFRSLCGAIIALVFLGSVSVFAADFTSSTTVNNTSLNFNNLGYTADGSFTVTIVNDACSVGVYTVNATPVNNSAPDTSTPPPTTVVTYIGFPAGGFFFGNAGVGEYTVTITQTSSNLGCVNGAQEVTVVTVGQYIQPSGGRVSSIDVPVQAPVDMVTPPVVGAEIVETSPETQEATEESDEEDMKDEVILKEDMEEVMHMDVCDEETVISYQAMLMKKTSDSPTTTYADALGNSLVQVKIYLNRYLNRAVSDKEKNDRIMSLVCKIEKTKNKRVQLEYTKIDYLLQYIQDLAILQFVK